MTDTNPHELIKTNAVLKLIGRSRSSLTRIKESDPTFPKAIKDGETRQAPSYYVKAEIEAWVQSKMRKRDAA